MILHCIALHALSTSTTSTLLITTSHIHVHVHVCVSYSCTLSNQTPSQSPSQPVRHPPDSWYYIHWVIWHPVYVIVRGQSLGPPHWPNCTGIILSKHVPCIIHVCPYHAVLYMYGCMYITTYILYTCIPVHQIGNRYTLECEVGWKKLQVWDWNPGCHPYVLML